MAEDTTTKISETDALAIKAAAKTAAERDADLSVQRRTTAISNDAYATAWWWASSAEDEISPWWSKRRESDLREFVKRPGNDILSGAVNTMIKKFRAMNWVVEGPMATVERAQDTLAHAEFGAGWDILLSKTVEDYLTQDQGAFWELIGEGDADGPIDGLPTGVAHLDSINCQLTGDVTWPVLYLTPKDGKKHRLHASRVVHFVDMPSPQEEMRGVGFSAVSRVISSSTILLKLARYKDEKLSDSPQAGLLMLNGVLPTQWDTANEEYQSQRRRLGQELWSNVMAFFSVNPEKPASAEFISFSGLPDQFDERNATEIYVNILALAFGVDVREFWPMSAGPLGTAQETLIQHQKAKGKGVGELISQIERAVNWYLLPARATFNFDFADDEEDAARAQIDDVKTKTIMSMWKPDPNFGAVVTQEEIRQMLADNVSYFQDEFLEHDLTEMEEATDTEQKAVKMDKDGNVLRARGKQAEKEIVFKDGEVEITTEDLEMLVVEAKERVGDDLVALLEAEVWPQKQ